MGVVYPYVSFIVYIFPSFLITYVLPVLYSLISGERVSFLTGHKTHTWALSSNVEPWSFV